MMRKLFMSFILVSCFLLLSACDPQIETYNNALDKDREAREKMSSALDLMREYHILVDNSDPGVISQEALDNRKSEALDAYKMAIESWAEAKEIYDKLISDYPDNTDYRNNLANLHYYMTRSGLENDIEKAQNLLNEAISENEKEIYLRNLELISSLSEDPEVVDEVEENKKIVAELEAMKSE